MHSGPPRRAPRLALLCGLVVAASVAVRPARAADLTLAGKTLTVSLSATTGQVLSLADSGGRRYLSRGEDRYDLDGKPSTEANDAVSSVLPGKDTLRLECVNADLGLKLAKQYRLVGGVLEKRVTYSSDRIEKTLLRLSSQALVEPELYRDGVYYLPTDDGYKVSALPFLSGAGVKEPIQVGQDRDLPGGGPASAGGLPGRGPFSGPPAVPVPQRLDGDAPDALERGLADPPAPGRQER